MIDVVALGELLIDFVSTQSGVSLIEAPALTNCSPTSTTSALVLDVRNPSVSVKMPFSKQVAISTSMVTPRAKISVYNICAVAAASVSTQLSWPKDVFVVW